MSSFRVPTGQGKLEKVREFVWSGKNIIFEKSEKMILDHADCRCYFLSPNIKKTASIEHLKARSVHLQGALPS